MAATRIGDQEAAVDDISNYSVKLQVGAAVAGGADDASQLRSQSSCEQQNLRGGGDLQLL